jgi:hypothetical protein
MGRAGRAGAATLPVKRAATFSRGATPVARECNPTRHAHGNAFRTGSRRSRGSANPTRHLRGKVFQTRHASVANLIKLTFFSCVSYIRR